MPRSTLRRALVSARFLSFVCVTTASIVAMVASPAMALAPRLVLGINGSAGGDDFGYSVSDAGDVNGDGYADMIVGARFYDGAGVDAGRAYVYFGGPAGDGIPDLTLVGVATDDRFGSSVSGAGDVNGDGYQDLIVGAPFNDVGGSNAGRAYVYYGGAIPNNVPDLTLTGAAANDQFGISVSRADDVNGDGFGDVIVGAHFNDTGGSNAGRAYIYYGGVAANSVADVLLTGAALDDLFGYSVSDAGDMNRDGFKDVIVGAYQNDGGGADAGRAYVYFGGSTMDATADVLLTGAAASETFGISVSSVGDMNGDDYDDVIVGAHGAVGGTGRAYVFHGGQNPDTVPDLTLMGEAVSDRFGGSVSGAGDVDGDGYADVIVGAHLNDYVGTSAGRAYVYYGDPLPNVTADVTLTGTATQDLFGISVTGVGDFDADGFPDVAVGAPTNDAGGLDAGRITVHTGRPFAVRAPGRGDAWEVGGNGHIVWDGSEIADLWISFDGGASYSILAAEVGGVEHNDFVVTVPSPETADAKVRVSAHGIPVTFFNSAASEGVFSIGRAPVPPPTTALLSITSQGAAAADNFGISVSGAGDVNGDGYADVIVGALNNDAGGSNAGRAYVFRGGPFADAVPDWTLTGEAAGDNFGGSVSDAGDVNGDGYGDVIVGAVVNNALTGRAYVYYGGPAADAVADLVLNGAAAGDLFGASVSRAGDVNADGYDDLIVGAPGNTSARGRAYVFHGGPGANATADLTLTGEAAEDGFGYAVSEAGDVNGDGYDDVVVGAPSNQAGGTNAGRVYVFYGGPTADSVADRIFTGAPPSFQLGGSVSDAGDVNGDGFDDVIALTSSGPEVVHVYHGGLEHEPVADQILMPEETTFGKYGSGAGDVNGDGYDDLIVGGAGGGYLYYGGPFSLTLARTFQVHVGVSSTPVAGAGDTNGDGSDDIVIGAPENDVAGTNAGSAYVYLMGRYHILAPTAGQTWNVGALKTVSWLGTSPAQVWLSADGGTSYSLLTPSAVGGDEENSLLLRVPHTPTKFARIRVTPMDSEVGGFAQTDSFFTIQTSVALLSLLAAPLPEGGVSVSWQSNPGPEDLAGYRLERSGGGDAWRVVASLTRETTVQDPAGGPGSRYRLFAVNGFGDELLLGETSIAPLKAISAWPLPYRGGSLTVAFASAGGLGVGLGRTEVAIYDVRGRLVRRLTEGSYPQGYHRVVWDGNDGRGRAAASGIYFLRSRSGGDEHTVRLAVLR